MEFQQLRYFAAAAEHGNFTRAAEACHVSQPSLSQQIIKLEKELDRPLFERLGRCVQLTDAGRTLQQHAAGILASVEEARERVVDSVETGRVAIGAIPTVAPYLIPALLGEFADRHPDAEINVHENLTERVVEGCLAGEFDLAIAALPVNEHRLEVESIGTDELLLATPAGHRLEKKQRVTMRDVREEPFILLDEAHCLGEYVVAFCREQECRPVVSCRSAQLLTVQELVALGRGVSLVPAMAAEVDHDDRRRYRSLSGTKPRRTLALCYHPHRHHSPLVEDLMTLVRVRGR